MTATPSLVLLFGLFAALITPDSFAECSALMLLDFHYPIRTRESFDEAEKFMGGNIGRVAAFLLHAIQTSEQQAIGDTRKSINSIRSCLLRAENIRAQNSVQHKCNFHTYTCRRLD
jgi:aspartate carbamoyltransferase catalytic subunit